MCSLCSMWQHNSAADYSLVVVVIHAVKADIRIMSIYVGSHYILHIHILYLWEKHVTMEATSLDFLSLLGNNNDKRIMFCFFSEGM